MRQVTRLLTRFVFSGVVLGIAAPDFVAAQPFRPPIPVPAPGRRFVPPPPPGVVRRVPVAIHPSRHVKHPPRNVIVRPPRHVDRHRVQPRLFLPPVVFGGVVVVERHDRRHRHDSGFSRESLVWKDTETLYREEEWTEFTLDCSARGTKLWFEVLEGRIQADWAEVVFENGEVQVVEFPERTLGPGIYELLDFREGRRVDYVRMVARSTTREAQLTLWLQR